MQRIITISLLVIIFVGTGISALSQDWKPLSSLSPASGNESILVKTVSASSQTITLIYAMPAVRVCAAQSAGLVKGAGENTQTVLLGNAPLSDGPGKPRLPVAPAKIALPPGCTISDVVIVPGDKIAVPGNYVVEHGQQPYPLMPGILPKPTLPDPDVYDSDAVYPGKLFDVVGVQQQCGVSIALVNLYPVEYKPLSGQLAYYSSLTLTVRTKPAAAKTVMRYRPEKLTAHRQGIDNPQALSEFYGADAAQTGDKANQAGICSPLQSFSYVIITSRAIRDATTDYTVRDLIALRQAQGFTATDVTVEDIYADYTGTDNAEKVRNFIKDAYNNWDTEYVLLGGDINVVPMRELWCDSLAGEIDDIPSDLYYQCLDGTYNNDGDAKWGEPNDGIGGGDIDLLAEVYVGRASAEDASEMANFVYKTIAYENDPASSSYKRKALMVGEQLGFGGASEYATGSMEEIRLGSSAHGYTTAGFAASPLYTVDTLYDSEAYAWDFPDILSKINSGNYSIFNHLGHANYLFLMKFSNWYADGLTNNVFSFIYSQGCMPGDFEEDCIAEHLTTSTRHGMFAGVFNSHFGWGARNSTDGPSQRYDREFWNAYFAEGMQHLGELNADSHEDNAWRINSAGMRWCYYASTLLGDPATQFISSQSEEPPSAPANVSATDGGYADKVRVTWNASSGASRYEVWRNSVNSTDTANRLENAASTFYDDTTATVGKTYYYWVKATNSYGISSFSSSDSGYRRAPTAGQVAFSAESYTVNENAGSVTLTVSRSGGSDGAASINYSTQNDTAIAGTDYTTASGTLSWSDGDSAGKTITVTIINRSGKQDNRAFTLSLSGASGIALASPSSASVTIADRSPISPTGMTATDGTYSDKVLVYWNSVSSAVSYNIWRGTDNNAQNASVLGTSISSVYLDTTASAGTIYYYWIQTVNEAGASDLSAPDSGYCESIALDLTSPAGIKAGDGTYTDRILITWQAVNNAVQYEVWRAAENDISTATLIKETTETSYSDTSAAQGIYYYYWVRAKNTNGYSVFSSSDAGWRRLSAPSGMSADDGLYPYHIRASWNTVTNALSYEVWREEVPGENSNGGNLCKVAQTGNTYFNDYQTRTGVYYRYKVKACNRLCASDYATETGVRRVATASALLPVLNDYDGDRLSDLALFNSSSGVLNVLCSALGQRIFTLAAISCSRGGDAVAAEGIHPPRRAATRIEIPIHEQSQGTAGDLDGDQIADPLAYYPDSGMWQTMLSSGNYEPIIQAQFGGRGNAVATADYDGDRLADPATYDKINGVLSVMLSSGGAFDNSVSCLMGGPGYYPVSADYDGDGLADPAVYSESDGRLSIMFSGSGFYCIDVAFGGPGQSMYSGDFDGDGKADLVLYDPSPDSPRPELGTRSARSEASERAKAGRAGNWTVFISSAGYSAAGISFGGPGYLPAIGDYDGDGLADPAVYRQTDGQWLIMLSGNGYSVITETFGGASFRPLGI